MARVVSASCVATSLEIGTQRFVGLVHPGCKARDASSFVRGLHRCDGVCTLGGREIALEDRVVVHAAFGLVREDRGCDAWDASHLGTWRPASVLLPGGKRRLHPAAVQMGVGQRGHWPRTHRSSQTRSRNSIPSRLEWGG